MPGIAGPDHADLQRLDAIEPSLPMRELRRIGTKVGMFAGMVSSVVPNTRARLIKGSCRSNGGKRFAAGNHRDIERRLQQVRDFGLDLQHDRPVHRRHRGNVADKVQGIAKPVLGVQQQRAAGQRLLPVRRIERWACVRPRLVPAAPVVLPETRDEVAGHQQEVRMIEARQQIVRIEHDGATRSRDGLVDPTEIAQRNGEIAMAPA